MLLYINFSISYVEAGNQIQIDKRVIYDCNKSDIDFSGVQLNIVKGGDLTIRNCQIQVGIFFRITVSDGRLELSGNEIDIDARDALLEVRKNRSSNAPEYWFIRVAGKSNILFRKNKFVSKGMYAAGFLYADTKKNKIYQIDNNEFKGFHGVLYLGSASGLVKGNYFFRNSFGNITASNADKLQVIGNSLLFPGNGTSGDGMTFSSITESTISGNSIIGGSCYGIAFHGENKNITIKKNIISDDNTTALYFSKKSNLSRVNITKNIFLNNGAWAIAFIGNAKDFVINDNTFHGNSDGKSHVLFNDKIDASTYEYSGNVEFFPISPKEIVDGFSHVQELNIN